MSSCGSVPFGHVLAFGSPFEQCTASRGEVHSCVPSPRHCWYIARFFVRDLIELVGSVYVLGLLPVGSHWLFSLLKAKDSRAWVAPELYLFVMVTCGVAFMDAFRDRDADGPLRRLVGVAGFAGLFAAAAAYGVLYVNPRDAAQIVGWLRAGVLRVMIVVAVGYLVYRFSGLLEDAIAEAREKSA